MRVAYDYIPTISDFVVDDASVLALVDRVNLSLLKLNEILRSIITSVNTIEFVTASTVENVLCDEISVEFSTAGTELTATHDLQKTPTAIVGTKLDRMGDIWFSSTPTSANIYLKSDTDSLSGTIILI